LEIGTIRTAWLPDSVRAAPSGAARAGQRDLREFRLDAFAEFEPDFAHRGDRRADGERCLLELGVGESLCGGEGEGKGYAGILRANVRMG
jgi:hypothetical protein